MRARQRTALSEGGSVVDPAALPAVPPPALHPRVSVNGMCFPPHSSLADDLVAWAAYGLTYVGLHDVKLYDYGADRAVELISDRRIRVATLYHRQAFDLVRPQDWDGQLAALCGTIDLAEHIEAGTVYITVGTAGSLRWDEACDAL